jgi:endonuclease-8
LFIAGIHPARRARELSKGEIGKLARATLDISQRSYATQGRHNPGSTIQSIKEKGRQLR